MNNFILAAENTSGIITLILLIVMVVFMLVMPGIAQKKRNAAYEEMKSRLRVGDRVLTEGKIFGKIHKIKESNGMKIVYIETGEKNNKSIIAFDINAIVGVIEGIPNPNASQPQITEEITEEDDLFDVSIEEPESQEEKKEEDQAEVQEVEPKAEPENEKPKNKKK